METHQAIILIISGLALILTPISWLIQSIRRLNQEINKLSIIISGINATQMAYKNGIDEMKVKCFAKHMNINKTLKESEEKINEHDTSIQLIQQKINK